MGMRVAHSRHALELRRLWGVDPRPLPCPAPPSLAGLGFLAASGPPRPALHPVDEWEFAECNHNFVINADSATDKGDDGFALVAPLNDQLVCELCGDCTLDAHEDEDGWLVLGRTLYLCGGCQRGYHSHCIQARVGPAAASLDRSLSDVS